MKNVTKFLAIAAILATPSIALAEVEQAPMAVHLSGLDLKTDAGAKTALKRIERAAAKFCTEDGGYSHIRHTDDACKTAMTSRAIASIEAPKLAQLYQSRHATVLVMAD